MELGSRFGASWIVAMALAGAGALGAGSMWVVAETHRARSEQLRLELEERSRAAFRLLAGGRVPPDAAAALGGFAALPEPDRPFPASGPLAAVLLLAAVSWVWVERRWSGPMAGLAHALRTSTPVSVGGAPAVRVLMREVEAERAKRAGAADLRPETVARPAETPPEPRETPSLSAAPADRRLAGAWSRAIGAAETAASRLAKEAGSVPGATAAAGTEAEALRRSARAMASGARRLGTWADRLAALAERSLDAAAVTEIERLRAARGASRLGEATPPLLAWSEELRDLARGLLELEAAVSPPTATRNEDVGEDTWAALSDLGHAVAGAIAETARWSSSVEGTGRNAGTPGSAGEREPDPSLARIDQLLGEMSAMLSGAVSGRTGERP